MTHYLISLTYSSIWLKLVFLPTVSLHAAPMQKRVLPASFACQSTQIYPNDATRKWQHIKYAYLLVNGNNKEDIYDFDS